MSVNSITHKKKQAKKDDQLAFPELTDSDNEILDSYSATTGRRIDDKKFMEIVDLLANGLPAREVVEKALTSQASITKIKNAIRIVCKMSTSQSITAAKLNEKMLRLARALYMSTAGTGRYSNMKKIWMENKETIHTVADLPFEEEPELAMPREQKQTNVISRLREMMSEERIKRIVQEEFKKLVTELIR